MQQLHHHRLYLHLHLTTHQHSNTITSITTCFTASTKIDYLRQIWNPTNTPLPLPVSFDTATPSPSTPTNTFTFTGTTPSTPNAIQSARSRRSVSPHRRSFFINPLHFHLIRRFFFHLRHHHFLHYLPLMTVAVTILPSTATHHFVVHDELFDRRVLASMISLWEDY
ncbi:hypothetical protein PIB30_026927 [Stylosanthes scabra]|uniref:Uncharacterized protein n=1 Tax=Stylosanthes scabra TaxID=79078 RepID=A0ABU6XAQ4_9FABA|nr:hypothetical protein [Stylosanthes scabra]